MPKVKAKGRGGGAADSTLESEYLYAAVLSALVHVYVQYLVASLVGDTAAQDHTPPGNRTLISELVGLCSWWHLNSRHKSLRTASDSP
jgi:hypothetical protein